MPKVVGRSIEMQKVGFFSLGDLSTGIKMRLGLGENSLNTFGNMSHYASQFLMRNEESRNFMTRNSSQGKQTRKTRN